MTEINRRRLAHDLLSAGGHHCQACPGGNPHVAAAVFQAVIDPGSGQSICGSKVADAPARRIELIDAPTGAQIDATEVVFTNGLDRAALQSIARGVVCELWLLGRWILRYRDAAVSQSDPNP